MKTKSGSLFKAIKNNLFYNYSIRPRESVCIVGGSNYDVIGSANRVKKGESTVGTIKTHPGGAARNIAENLGKLGVNSIFISAVGVDVYGDLIIDSLNSVGVDTAKVLRVANKETGQFVVILDKERENHLAVSDMSVLLNLNRQYIRDAKSDLEAAKIVVVDCNLKHEAMDELFKLAEGKVYVDLVSPTKAVNIIPYLNRIEGFYLGQSEAKVLTGIYVADDESAFHCISFLIEKGVHNICLSLGPEAMMATDGKTVIKYSFELPEASYIAGAKDALLAAWVCRILRKSDTLPAIRSGIVSYISNSRLMYNVDRDISLHRLEELEKIVKISEKIYTVI